MSDYERLENLKLVKEFPPLHKGLEVVTIYEDDFDWLMEQAEKAKIYEKALKEIVKHSNVSFQGEIAEKAIKEEN